MSGWLPQREHLSISRQTAKGHARTRDGWTEDEKRVAKGSAACKWQSAESEKMYAKSGSIIFIYYFTKDFSIN